MKSDALGAEMTAAVSALTEIDIEMLVQHGVDPADVAMGMIGRALIRVEGDLFFPHPEGKFAFTSAVRVHYPISPESNVPDSAVRVGDLVDLVAWHPARADRWALRTGAAEWLGAIGPQYLRPDPVPVRRSVLAWFQAECTGLLPLSRSPVDAYRLLRNCIGGLVAEDEQHAAELRRALTRPWPVPHVLVRDRERRHAA